MPDWRKLSRAAVTEANPGYLEHLIHEAEDAMYARLLELDKSSGGDTERYEIREAAKRLLDLKSKKHSTDATVKKVPCARSA
jgi:hypothetical protein